MNNDRRATGQVCIELIKECADIGEISTASHDALREAVESMRRAEYWQLRTQTRHAGKNDSTDQQIAISTVALPALEAAVAALVAEDYDKVIEQLELAIKTDGTPPKARRKK